VNMCKVYIYIIINHRIFTNVLLFTPYLSHTRHKTEYVYTPYVLAIFDHEWPANGDTVSAAAVRILYKCGQLNIKILT
jgi:hypothetical protein